VRRHLSAPNLSFVALTALLALLAPGTVVAGEPLPVIGEPHANRAVLVSYKPGVSATRRAAAASLVDALDSVRLSHRSNGPVRLELGRGMTVEAALKVLRRQSEVAYAEPDYAVAPALVANDTWYANGSLWGMYGDQGSPANAFGTGANEAWAQGYVGSREVYVGVVDEGVQISHPDLAANIWTNPFELAGNGRDDDGNGYVDDIHGWDFANNDASVYDGGSGATSDNHGTHVSGTIGAIGGNGAGVAGVNWKVTIIPTKFMGANGGFISGAIAALDYLTDLHERHGLNVVASNNSWGGGGFSQALLDAIERAGDAGMLFVAAAGNSGANNDVTTAYPANLQCTSHADGSPRGYDCVVSVAALTNLGALAGFSACGATSVDLAAPGANVYSTVAFSKYAAYSGTSMATPHVTGALALCASIGGLGAADLRAAVLNSVAATPALVGKTANAGRLDVGAMIPWCAQSTQPVSGAPSDLRATVLGTQSVDLGWVNGARHESGFEVQQALVAGTVCGPFSALARTAPDATAYRVDGLLPGTSYCFRVRATNSFGGGSYSDWTNVVRVDLPATPRYDCSRADYAWTDASGPGYALSDDGMTRVSLPSGFGFDFYGQPASWVDISANGFVLIGAENAVGSPWSNSALPSAAEPNGMAAAWWDDLNPNNETRIWTQVLGSAPNRVVVVEWRDIRPFAADSTSGVTFEVRLEEAADVIAFSYKDVTAGVPAFDGAAAATVGVEDPQGATATQISFNSAVIAAGTTYRCVNAAKPGPAPDTTAPTALAPTAILSSGQALGSQARIQLAWPAASDPSGIAAYDLQYRVGSDGWSSIGLGSTNSLATEFGVTPGQAYEFRIGARDGAGNVGWSSPSSVLVGLRQEGNSSVAYEGAFRLTALDGASGGKVRQTGVAGRIARLSFNGNGVAFVTTLGAKRGIAEVWLDGARVATLDLYAATKQPRVVAWSKSVPTGNHVLEIRTTGTHNPVSASNRIDIDAFLVQQ
jgi:subtilase family protein/fibronectin type III domain protein/fervidolysin-like protein